LVTVTTCLAKGVLGGRANPRRVGTKPEALDRGDLRSTTYEFFILAVSVLSILNLVFLAVIPFRSQSWLLVSFIDSALTIIFVTDFVLRFTSAPSKRTYMRRGGVLDLIACLPGLRIFRLFRIVRAVRIVRGLGGPRVLRELRAGLASGTLYFVVFVGIAVLEFIGLLVLRFEQDAPGANITGAGDALWWGYVTATTVGYGDQFPVTTGGRIAGLMMLTVGVALFATFSGFLANIFLSAKRAPSEVTDDSGLSELLGRIERLQDEQRATVELLRARVAGHEQTP
jgi:voltage-gated potassium channel